MRSIKNLRYTSIFCALLGTLCAQSVFAKTSALSGDVTVDAPAQLPAAAREPGIALYLHHKNSNGSVYLYVEQENGTRLALFDVTDPGHIRALGTITLATQTPFEFAENVGMDAVLLRARDGHATALLDLHKPSAPALRTLPENINFDNLNNIGNEVYTSTESQGQAASTVAAQPQDIRIYDLANPQKPVLISTAHQVIASIHRTETATTFLLGSDGLTVVRHPREEEQFSNWLKQY
jgi:hypothetical protein